MIAHLFPRVTGREKNWKTITQHLTLNKETLFSDNWIIQPYSSNVYLYKGNALKFRFFHTVVLLSQIYITTVKHNYLFINL